MSAKNKSEAQAWADAITARVRTATEERGATGNKIATTEATIVQLENKKQRLGREIADGKQVNVSDIITELNHEHIRLDGLKQKAAEQDAALAPLRAKESEAVAEVQRFVNVELLAEGEQAVADATARRQAAWDAWLAAEEHFNSMKARLSHVRETVNAAIVRKPQMPIVGPERISTRH